MNAILKKQPPKFSENLADLLVTISIITGWKLNKNAAAMETLVTQLSYKLAEDYPTITAEQIEDAFRRHGTDEQDFGKTINVALVARVLTRYFAGLAQENDFAERSNKLYVTGKRWQTPEQELQETRAMLESKYQLFLVNKCQFDLLPAFAFDRLQKDFGIVPELPQRFVATAKKILNARQEAQEQARRQQATGKEKRDPVAIGPLFSEFLPEKTLDELCKKLALEYAFKRFAGLNMEHIYEPINN